LIMPPPKSIQTGIHRNRLNIQGPVLQVIDILDRRPCREWKAIGSANCRGTIERVYGRIGVPPKSEGVLESSLYVDDVAGSAVFYERVFGFHIISDFGERGCAMQAGKQQVLLLFKKGASRSMQSPHHGDGELHIAFAVPASELGNWEAWLAENGIPVEEKRTWELGGKSVYFRDPDRHLIEIATPGVWSIY
jgi:catechol 2,3-dioxygenase-like lactoylglutathione lyase family enzyme